MNKRRYQNDCGFTLPEILVSMAVVLVLGSIATIFYQRMLDSAREAVCTTNVKALTTAVETYAIENDVLPAVLGDLDPGQLKKAYAHVLQKSGYFARFSQHIVEWNLPRTAYAVDFLTYERLKDFGVPRSVFLCPSDEDGGTSYGINANLLNKRWDEIDDDTIIVADCDSPVFTDESQLKKRHRNKTTAVASCKDKNIKKNPGAQDIAVTTPTKPATP